MERTINDVVKEWVESQSEVEDNRCMGECEGCTGDPDCDHFLSKMWYNRNVP